jgi:hypothetical protein
MENIKTCYHCGKAVYGRSDKKFCTNHCRSEYNNKKIQTEGTNNSILRINRILQQNRYILVRLLGKSLKKCVSQESLIGMGFHFGFHTHIVRQKENTKIYCYDAGYMKKNERDVVVFFIQDE